MRAFQQKNYAEAIRDFERHLADYPADAAAWYNLGNSYLSAGEAPLAVWAYDKTLRLDPGMSDAQHNLEQAERRIPELVPARKPLLFQRIGDWLLSPAQSNPFAVLALILFSAACAAFLVRRRWHRFWFIRIFASLLTLAAVSLTVSCLAAKNLQQSELVIVTAGANFYPSDTGEKPGSVLPGGSRLRAGEHRSGRIRVTLADGRSGWIPEPAARML